MVDEKAIEEGVLGGDFLDQQQTAVVADAAADFLHDAFAQDRAGELQIQQHGYSGSIFYRRVLVDDATLPLEWVVEAHEIDRKIDLHGERVALRVHTGGCGSIKNKPNKL